MDTQNWLRWLPLGFIAIVIVVRVISFLVGRRRTYGGLRLMGLGIVLTIGAALFGAFAYSKLGEAYLQFVHDAVVSRSQGH